MTIYRQEPGTVQASPAQPGPPPTTDFRDWAIPTWECRGDDDGNHCEPRWKAPEYPDPLYTPTEKKAFLDIYWPRILISIIFLIIVAIMTAPWPRFWCVLLGLAVALLINNFLVAQLER